MAETPAHAPGTFCWVELGSTDQDRAKEFYSSLFGWRADDAPMGEGATYTMFRKGDRATAGLYQVEPELPNAAPDCWSAYVAVQDADSTVATARSKGALVLADPFDVFDIGRMAVIQDPGGAVLALWQAGAQPGVELKSEHGALCWNELLTRDAAGAKDFYEALFGWTAHDQPMPPPTGLYTTFMLGSFPAGGMMTIGADWGDVPPHWATYFAVDDCDATLARVRELGGSVLVPAMDIPNVGRFAWVSDPLGAAFAVITLVER